MKRGIRKQEKGNAFHEENRVDSKFLENDLRVRTIYRIIDWYKQGLLRHEIITILQEEGDYDELTIRDLLLECTTEVYEQFATQAQDIVGLHIKRYNKQIQSLLNKDYNKYSARIRFKMKTTAFFTAIDTLYQKEKLLNLHSKQTIYRFNQRNNINVNPNPSSNKKFDTSKLTLEEKIDFLRLISKCSLKNNNTYGVILRNTAETQEEVIDIQYEEELNITKIAQENIVGVDVFPSKEPKTIFDLKQKLKIALDQAAKKAFLEAGSKTIENNERDM